MFKTYSKIIEDKLWELMKTFLYEYKYTNENGIDHS